MRITRNILDFYEENNFSRWYLKKYFTNTLEIGYYSPYATNVILNKYSGEPFLPIY